jgi:hypothetical protein
MAYDPTIPDESNLVTEPVSGDLVKMRGNFVELAPLVSGTAVSGTAPSAALRGFYLGDDTNRKRYFIQSDGSDRLQIQRNTNTEASPSWQSVISLGQVSGATVDVPVNVSGITPVSGEHLATKAYVDGATGTATLSGLTDTAVSGATSGQILVYDGTYWQKADHTHVLNDMLDVSFLSPASGEVLAYNGTQWSADALTLSSLSDLLISGATSGQALIFDGTQWTDNADLIVKGTAAVSGTCTVGPGGAGDSVINFLVNDVLTFIMGIDDSDADKLKISSADGFGLGDFITLSTAGAVVMSGTCTIGPGGAGDSVVNFLTNDVLTYILGIDDSDADKLKLSTADGFGLGDLITVTSAGVITTSGELHAPGGFYPRRLSQNAAPVSGTTASGIDAGELQIWNDADGDHVSLVYNDAVRGVVSGNLGPDPAWIAPTLSGDWVDYGSAWQVARYRKDRRERIYMEGLIKKPTPVAAAAQYVIFTLPPPYRPEAGHLFAGAPPANLGMAKIWVYSTGNVTALFSASGSTVDYLTLDGITFDRVSGVA